MKEIVRETGEIVFQWLELLALWQKCLLIVVLVILCCFWLAKSCNISEWWRWSEWREHIRNNHKKR
ncbi:MAG: hypothetical protein ACI4PM_02220 [Butyricicoccus sp.]